MNKLFFFLIILVCLASCVSEGNKDPFFENCNDSRLKLESEIEVTDSLCLFSYNIPDSSWRPMRTYSEKENSWTVGDTSEGYMRFFIVSQLDYSYDWNWEEELEFIEKSFNVIERGELMFRGDLRPYHLIFFDEESPKYYSLYLTYIEASKKCLFTLTITVEDSPDYKNRICEMRPILESFNVKD